MDFLDLVNDLTPEELSELADIVGATAVVRIEMLDDESQVDECGVAPTPEMKKLADECARLGAELSRQLLAFNEAAKRAALGQAKALQFEALGVKLSHGDK